MKKITFITALTFLFLAPLQAQHLDFGVKGGVNFASITGDDTDELKSKTGFHLGLVAELSLSENFSIQPEVLYSAQGAKAEGSDTWEGMTETWDYTYNLDYINIPVLAKYYVTPSLNIHAGPQMSLLINSQAEGEYTYDGVTESESMDLEDVKSLDFALAAGVGYQLNMGVFFNARYNVGLSNIWDIEEENDDYSQKNSVFQLSVGFMF